MVAQVIILDDQWSSREGLAQAIDECRDLSVAHSTASLADAVRFLRNGRGTVDVMVVDVALRDDSVISVIPQLVKMFPGLAILAHSLLPERPHAVRAIEQGAAGFVSKRGSRDELLEALRMLAEGRRYVSPEVGRLLAERLSSNVQLTARESEIVRLFADGRRCSEIAATLALSPKTVSAHKSNAMDKLGIDNNADLIRWAIGGNAG